ncbi:hypothetical protein HDV00_008924 [Rhizophlyctis rosea]|nr:hypothetical protein HDV00_008924 [Rhizophlyctis rosea]
MPWSCTSCQYGPCQEFYRYCPLCGTCQDYDAVLGSQDRLDLQPQTVQQEPQVDAADTVLGSPPEPVTKRIKNESPLSQTTISTTTTYVLPPRPAPSSLNPTSQAAPASVPPPLPARRSTQPSFPDSSAPPPLPAQRSTQSSYPDPSVPPPLPARRFTQFAYPEFATHFAGLSLDSSGPATFPDFTPLSPPPTPEQFASPQTFFDDQQNPTPLFDAFAEAYFHGEDAFHGRTGQWEVRKSWMDTEMDQPVLYPVIEGYYQLADAEYINVNGEPVLTRNGVYAWLKFFSLKDPSEMHVNTLINMQRHNWQPPFYLERSMFPLEPCPTHVAKWREFEEAVQTESEALAQSRDSTVLADGFEVMPMVGDDSIAEKGDKSNLSASQREQEMRDEHLRWLQRRREQQQRDVVDAFRGYTMRR